MKLIVLTGGIACGKTTVGDYLQQYYNIPIIDSDKITYQLQRPGGSAYAKIVKVFGDKYLNSDKTINRKKLGDLVFHDFSERRKLNHIVHPLVLRTIFCETIKCWFSREPIVVVDVPLFFEIHMKPKFFDEVVTVAVKPEVQIERLMKRNNFSLETAESRIKSQIPIEKKCKQSTFVINNEGSKEETKKQVDSLIKKLRSENQIFTRYPDPIFLLFLLLLIIVVIVFITKRR
ncbi:Dephospho-CoA kinase cab5 [Tritrichomonas musculus]|uniref:Dephospho-CoA kinase cab5 n=1 Tax=Tritrichomonas musculus TaxID=1915356 RepID=A0ABR2K991_9EUKA